MTEATFSTIAWGSRPKAAILYTNILDIIADQLDEPKLYYKQTLLPSPVIVDIYPQFKMWTNKPLTGLLSENDDEDNYLWMPKEESLLLKLDSVMLFLWENKNNTMNPETFHRKMKTVEILVKRGSLNVNGMDFKVNSSIKTSCLIKGAQRSEDSGCEEEDSLLISLDSGYILLVRLYEVPVNLVRGVGFKNWSLKIPSYVSSETVLRPYVVQWWSTNHIKPHSALNIPGHLLLANSATRSVVVTSPSNMFRIHTVESTPMGNQLSKHFNVRVAGTILHSCLSEVTLEYSDNYHTLFIANFTSSNRLEYNIFMWNLKEGIPQSLRKYTLLMDNSTNVPIMVKSLPNNLGFLAICRTNLYVIGIDNITSANYKFKNIPFDGGFPTAAYIPQSPIRRAEEKSDEVLFTADNGAVYSFVMNGPDDLSVKAIARIADPVSVFTFERKGDANDKSGFLMTFGSHNGSNRKILITELLGDSQASDETKLPYNNTKTVVDYKNWSPLNHIKLLSTDPELDLATTLHQELWAISGEGKRSRLVQLRRGLLASRISYSYNKLKKCFRISVLEWKEKIILACSLPFETIFVEYIPLLEECFAELIDETLPVKGETLAMSVTNDMSCAIIFKLDSIVLTNFGNICETIHLGENTVFLFVELIGEYIYHITQKTKGEETEIVLLKLRIVGNEFISEKYIYLDSQPSYLGSFELHASRYVMVGTYDAKIDIFTDDLLFFKTIALDYHVSGTRSNFVSGFIPGHVVPHDILFFMGSEFHTLLITTKAGYFVNFSLSNELDYQRLNVRRMDNNAIKLLDVQSNYGGSVLLVSLKTWMVNKDDLSCFRPVYFDERKDRAIKTACKIPGTLGNSFFYVRDDGLCVADITTYSKPNVRQVSLGEEVKSLEFFENTGLFAIVCNLKKSASLIKFCDKRYLKLLDSEESSYKKKEGTIFTENVQVTCTCVWNVVKEGKISKRLLLVGCSDANGKGMVKVLDICKIYKEDVAIVKVTELFLYALVVVPSNIIQVGGQIFYSGESTLRSIDYDPERKSFSHTSDVVSFPSDIVSLHTNGSWVYVTTEENSVFQYELDKERKLQRISHDTFPRNTTNVAITSKSDVFMGESATSFVMKMTSEDSVLRSIWSYRFPFIPRVYPGKVCFGTQRIEDDSVGVLCVGTDGSVVAIQLVSESSYDVKKLHQYLTSLTGRKLETGDKISDIFDYPVLPSRNMGRGLLALNRPCFDFEENSDKVVDFDIDQLEEVCTSSDI